MLSHRVDGSSASPPSPGSRGRGAGINASPAPDEEPPLIYRIIADAILTLHLGYIAFVVFGGFLAARRPWLRWVHLPAAVWGMLVSAGNLPCPLTRWELYFRRGAGEAGYAGSFIEHYLVRAIYPAGLTREMQIAMAVGVVAINLWAYRRLILRRRARDAAPA